MFEFEKPRIEIAEISDDNKYGKFVVEPLERGYCGFIEELYDIYRIDRYETEIVKLEGFGQKSYDNMMESIEASRTTQLARVLYGLGILNVGTAMAKSICKYFKDDVEAIIHADAAQFAEIEKIGDVIALHFGERTLAVEVLDVSETAGKSEASLLYREVNAQ